MILIWFVCALFIILTLYFISGKGGWLISGYNTLPADQKAQYDEKRLCKWMGFAILMPLDIFLLLILLQKSESYILLESVVFVVYIIGMIVFTNVKGIGKIKQ